MIVNVAQFVPVITTIMVAALASFIVSMALTPIYTYLAFRYKAWKQIRRDSITGERAKIYHKLHADKHKRNIPTMAGLIMVTAIAIVTFSFNFSRSQTYLPLLGTIAAGLIGLLDDFINIRGTNWQIAGLRSRMKLALITGVALIVSLFAYYKLGYRTLEVPFLDQIVVGWLLIPLFTFVIVATANAVNITDGLDGLSGGLLATAFSMYAIISFLQGNYGIATNNR